jgi:AcrR family transcriptional regulator
MNDNEFNRFGGRRPRGRPPVITNERLLEVAREVFLEKGIRATTADVAERAKVSEGTVFHRFPTKEALFRAAMDFDPTVEPPLLAELPARVGAGDLRRNLVEVGIRMLEIASVAMPLALMAWSNPGSEFSYEKLARGDARVDRRIDVFRRFFAAEQAGGRIAPTVDPNILARAFVGGLHHHCLAETLFPQGELSRATRQAFVEGLVTLLLDGASPSRSKGAR